MSNQALIEKFYTSFASGDAEGMVSCYHPDIRFEDPAFGVLQGKRAGDMWRMLLSNRKSEVAVRYSDVKANEKIGSAQWTADYVFSQSGRKVHNIIIANFEFKDGLIIRHTDHFDLYRWSKQALGLSGWLLGWTPLFKKKLQQKTNGLLDGFIRKL
jgi:ketosteroid isomerase-like protein